MKMIEMVLQMSLSECPPIISTDAQIISQRKIRNDRSLHARRKDKSIPTIKNNKNLTEMAPNERTQSSHKDKQENCLYHEYWSNECVDELSCNFNSNPDKSSSIIHKYNYTTPNHQPIRISQSSTNQKSALLQSKYFTISRSNNKCKNINQSNLSVNIIQNCQELYKRWTRCSMNLLSQTSIILLCVLSVLVLGTTVVDAVTKDGICQSKDIRNEPKNLAVLENCRVIEGFLMITLMDQYNESDYANMSFPDLIEITEFMMLYRIQGLKTLEHLFPNLQVIRGINLVDSYALIIYQLNDLAEIGLKSLTAILRGGARIENNPQLCYVHTVNWLYIANGTQEEDHFLNNNHDLGSCPMCPNGKPVEKEENNPGPYLDCPMSQLEPKRRYCWNQMNCQKICAASCRGSCDEMGNCCADQCLGSCNSTDRSKCEVCRTLTVYRSDNRQCVDKCPNDLYAFQERRCITDAECWNTSRPFKYPSPTDLPETLTQITNYKNPFIPFEGMCTATCPQYYEATGADGERTCKPCNGECKKECSADFIADSISNVQRYRGCSIIKGTLKIQISQGVKVVKELQQAFGDVEVIDGGLRIMRSYSLVSLNFFKKLHTITGHNAPDNYSVYMMDNQNLQSLFAQEVKVEHGKLFFHFNSKLCYNIIENLKKDVADLKGVDKIPIEDVAPNSNGDKVACNLTKLVVKVTKIWYVGVEIEVNAMKYDDIRVLLGYVLYYKKSPYQNISLYDERDACGGDGWTVVDTTNFDRKETTKFTLTDLNPFTQYAFYVKTYTIASETYGGQSEILYFQTLSWQPGIVEKLKVTSVSSSSIVINWERPRVPNGKLTNYIVKASIIADSPELLKQRNYCEETITKFEDPVLTPPNPKQTEKQPNNKQPHCECPKNQDENTEIRKTIPTDAEATQVIDFENLIQNIVYVKKTAVAVPEETRRRREIDKPGNFSIDNSTVLNDKVYDANDGLDTFPHDNLVEVNDFDNSSEKHGYYIKFYDNQTDASTFSYTLTKLKHFSLYAITVQACRDFKERDYTKRSHCSNSVSIYRRTEKLDNADNIRDLTFRKVSPDSNSSSSTVNLIWTAPSNPNGLVTSYTIQYRRVDADPHIRGESQCISHLVFQKMGGQFPLLHLPNGNYSVTVRAQSLAGEGNFTPPMYILIDESNYSSTTIISIVLGILFALGIIFYAMWFFFRRRYGSPVSDLKLIASVNPEYVGMQYQVDEWEVPRENVIQLRELGQGSFGMVYEGLVKNKDGDNVPCAIKTVNENATDRERINFLKEAGVMKAFDTHHVVRLLGVVSATQPTLVVMELMVNGDLKGYLRSHRQDADNTVQPIAQPPSLKRILQMALEISDGMAYLSAKKFVHRDLAARNCMVADDLTVKIGDFGMTRDIYETDYYRKGTKGLLPVRWMAPESLKDGVFTSGSDVFSYGIVLWEIATGASQPYQGLSNDQVLRYVIDGGVMERPENCPEKLYRLMCRTWQHRPSSRPSFLQIVSMLLDDAVPNFRKVSFYHTQEAQELLLHPQNRTMIIDVTTPLKAEEDDFSLDDLAPDAYLMSDIHTRIDGKTEGGASHSPLRSSLGLRRLTSSILDVASSKSNKNSPVTTINPSSLNSANQTQSMLGRNGGQFNRGMEFLRNAFFYKNGGNNTDNESTEYRKLHTKNDSTNPINNSDQSSMTVVGIEDNLGAIKRQNLSNGFVVSDKTDLG